MNDKFIVGLVLGFVGGALIVANSVKVREMVKKSQTEAMEKVKDMKKSATKKRGESGQTSENAEANE